MKINVWTCEQKQQSSYLIFGSWIFCVILYLINLDNLCGLFMLLNSVVCWLIKSLFENVLTSSGLRRLGFIHGRCSKYWSCCVFLVRQLFGVTLEWPMFGFFRVLLGPEIQMGSHWRLVITLFLWELLITYGEHKFCIYSVSDLLFLFNYIWSCFLEKSCDKRPCVIPKFGHFLG